MSVVVVDCESEPPVVVAEFHTVMEAESFIGSLPDEEKVLRGGYGIDADEITLKEWLENGP